MVMLSEIERLSICLDRRLGNHYTGFFMQCDSSGLIRKYRSVLEEGTTWLNEEFFWPLRLLTCRLGLESVGTVSMTRISISL